MKTSDLSRPGANGWQKATYGVVALGTLLSVLALFRSLEYDEAWTLLYYVPLTPGKIFGDLATPNNHPLNTVLIKLAVAIFGEKSWAMRLPSLLCGAGTLLLGIGILRQKCQSPVAVLTGSAALAFSGILVHYAATARGYALQTFSVMLAAWAMTELMQNDRNRRAAWLLVAGALAALFAITSGALLVTALALAGWAAYLLPIQKFGEWIKAHGNLWLCGAIFAIATLAWFLPHLAALQEARKFGIPLAGALDYGVWAGRTLWNLRIVLWMLAAIGVLTMGAKSARRDAWFALLFPVFALLLSLATNAGPERVYIALVPVTVVWSTIALAQSAAEPKRAKLFLGMAVAAALGTVLFANFDIARHEGPDWGAVGAGVCQLPPEVFPLYRPGDSFPVFFNCADAAEDMSKRLEHGKFRKLLAVAPPPGKLEAADAKHAPAAFEPSAQGVPAGKLDRADLVLYELRPLTAESQVEGKTLLVQIPPHLHSSMAKVFSHPAIADEKAAFLECNLFLNQRSATARTWLLPQAKHPAADYLQAAESFSHGVRFYELATPNEKTAILTMKATQW